jgi:hypothetical protein
MPRSGVFEANSLYTRTMTATKAVDITTTAMKSRTRCRRLKDDWPVQSINDEG